MDDATRSKLTGLPWIGPFLAKALRSRPWQVYDHLDDRAWTRLAAAITFTSFLALFPLLAFGGALGSALLSRGQLEDIERWVADQVPGISEQLGVGTLFDNATAIGIIALLLLLPTGISWIDSLRDGLRTVWGLPEPDDNPLLRRVKDLGVLAGLGAVALLSLAVSAVALSAVHWATGWLGLARDGIGGPLLQLAGHLVAGLVTFLLLAYVLVWLPGVRPPSGATVVACLIGAIGFELLKVLLSGYITEVATKNVYGAFGVPIALLVWINLVAKLLLFCCAWVATAISAAERSEMDALEAGSGGGTRNPRPPAVPG